ncbi:histidinol-phosphatase [Inquilinus limosus]|uniref:histidinol-phosphatase n=1 Tax=Inquilinus limosus TaxID=171674 RepID=UPI00042990CD|nr:histidinol-phosphatase [Inquilinus limosus]
MTADPFVAFAESLADAARPAALRWFRTGLAVEDKPDASPVTLADRSVERQMRQMIADRYPEHGILGEEHGREGLDRDLVWVLDPIDGTRAFIAGIPLFGTLIALTRGGRPLVGVIEMPALGERFVGHAGHPTLANGKPCHTRDCGGLGNAILSTTAPEMFTGVSAAVFERLAGAVKYRRYGCDCYAYALIALGCIDVVIERGLQPYDFMALVPVIEGAGGVITDWQGKPLGIDSSGDVLAAATPALHRAALERIGAG